MLHCNMDSSRHALRIALEDLLADLEHARRTADLGRLALLTYCELRRWARTADRQPLAAHAHEMFLGTPYADRESFLRNVDRLIDEAQQCLSEIADDDCVTGANEGAPQGPGSLGSNGRVPPGRLPR
jgi:hypothetical protein